MWIRIQRGSITLVLRKNRVRKVYSNFKGLVATSFEVALFQSRKGKKKYFILFCFFKGKDFVLFYFDQWTLSPKSGLYVCGVN